MFCGLFGKKKSSIAPSSQPCHTKAGSSIEWRVINGTKYWTTRNYFVDEKADNKSHQELHIQALELGGHPAKQLR